MSVRTTKAVVFGRVFANALLTGLTTLAGAALLATGKLRLSNDPAFNPTPSTLLAALTAAECAYSGYTAGGIAVVMTGPLNVTVDIQGVSQSHLFEAVTASPFITDTAYGWWIDDGTDMLLAGAFADDGPVAFQAPNDFLQLLAILPVSLLQPTE